MENAYTYQEEARKRNPAPTPTPRPNHAPVIVETTKLIRTQNGELAPIQSRVVRGACGLTDRRAGYSLADATPQMVGTLSKAVQRRLEAQQEKRETVAVMCAPRIAELLAQNPKITKDAIVSDLRTFLDAQGMGIDDVVGWNITMPRFDGLLTRTDLGKQFPALVPRPHRGVR